MQLGKCNTFEMAPRKVYRANIRTNQPLGLWDVSGKDDCFSSNGCERVGISFCRDQHLLKVNDSYPSAVVVVIVVVIVVEMFA